MSETFDAGELGCGAELAEAIRSRLAALPPGATLAVVVRDPAAKVDLPALAWLLGHEVASERRLDARATQFLIRVNEKRTQVNA